MNLNSTRSKLNYDILVLASYQLACLPDGIVDVSAISRTCRRLHLECAPLLLSPPRPVRLNSDRDIESFCRYILADTDRRAHLLSQCPVFHIGGSDAPSEVVTDLLVEMLGHISTLQCLFIHHFEEFMSRSPRVFQAFAAIPHTNSLSIMLDQFPGKLSYTRFLKAIVAPLKAVKLFVRDYDDEGNLSMEFARYNRNLDPLWLFSSFSSTLEYIFLDGHITVEACSAIHVYPRLTHIMITHQNMPYIRPYIQAVPFLQDLRFNMNQYLWGPTLMPTEDVQEVTLWYQKSEDLRRRNREDQLVYGSWPALECFMGMTLDAYMTGITCRIRTLHLVAWGGSMEREVLAICAIVADARPSVFRLALRPQHVDYISSLFSQRHELFSLMESLELRLDVTTVPFDFKSYFDGIETALQRLPITSLQVEIKCWAEFTPLKRQDGRLQRMYCDEPCASRKSQHQRCYTLDALSSEDMDGRLRHFLQKIRTLRRVTIAWGRCLVNIPHRLITIDLDNVPHRVDRPGRDTDNHWRQYYRV